MFWIINLLFSYLATIGFGIIVNIPRRALNTCGFIGVGGWLAYIAIHHYSSGVVFSNLGSAYTIGILSVIAARHRKIPMIVFNIPSLVPLVPGGQSYKAVRYFVLGNNDLGIEYIVQVLLIAGSIAMGLFLAELTCHLFFKIYSWARKKVGFN